VSVTFEPASDLIEWDDELSLNFNSANAAEVLQLLGHDASDPYGDEDAVNFLGRVLLALALPRADEARPAIVEGRWIRGARRDGYLSSRLKELHGMAEHCVAHGLRVRWH
jgi:hypothetical protein